MSPHCDTCGRSTAVDCHVCGRCAERANAPRRRDFDVIHRVRWTLIAEWIGSREDGERTARWFRDEVDGCLYVAESWKRPNLARPLSDEQVRYVCELVPELGVTR